MNRGELAYQNYLAGDREAFSEVIDVYRHGLTYFLLRYVGDLTTAEELAEDTFAVLVAFPSRYHFRTSLKTYLYTVGRNKAVDFFRRHRREISMEADGGFLEAEAMQGFAVPEEALLQKEGNERLYRAMRTLKKEYCDALTLSYFDQFSNAEIAHIMKKTKKQVENLLTRGRIALRKSLEEQEVCP